MAKRYIRINWQDKPSTATPLSATFLNKMDKGIDDIDNAVETLDTNKINNSNIANNLVTTAEGLVLDARQGKVLDDKVTAINSNLAWESWQTLTLLNDWAGTLQVRKNGLGIIQLKGRVTVGVKNFGTTIAQLPTGFNSSYLKNVEFFGATGDLIDGIAVTPDGNLVVYRPAVSSFATGIIGYIDQFYNVAS